MRRQFAALAALSLGIALGSSAWAQDDKSNAGKSDKNRPQTITVQGVIAGVTAEGETAVDYKTNRAVVVEAAALTIVGSPVKDGAGAPGEPGRQGHQAKGERSGRHRHNVYVAWLTPRTKVCAMSGDSKAPGEKKEVALDALEVGDRVEVQLGRRDESAANAGANHTESMRRKHGRHRIHVGDALAITILPPKEDETTSPSTHDSSKGATGRPNPSK